MHISEKSEPARAAEERKIVSPLIAGDARYELARSTVGSIFVLNAYRFPAPSSSEWIRGTGRDIRLV
jgi:hypothetical protein